MATGVVGLLFGLVSAYREYMTDSPSEPNGSLVPPSDPLVPASLGSWFERIVGVISRSFVPLLAIQTGVAVASVIFEVIERQLTSDVTSSGSSAEFSGHPFSTLGSTLVSTLAQGMSIFIAIRDAAGERTSVGTALNFAAGRALPLLGWGIVTGIMIVLGFVLVIVPGIYLAIVFTATLIGVVAVERAAIDRCFNLVNRRFWPTAKRMLLFFLFSIIYFVVVAIATPEANSIRTSVLISTLFIPFGIVSVAVSLVTYAELRFHENPDVLTPELAAELRR